MRASYPTYPQPIITHPTTGLNWYLELSNAGILRAGGTTTDAPTTKSRLRLVDPTGQAGYQLGLNTDVTPTVTATALVSPLSGNYQDLPVWSVNGREWNVRVTSAGAITVTAISSDWPMLKPQTPHAGYPIHAYNAIGVFDGAVWTLGVNDGGIMSTSGPAYPAPLTSARGVHLLDETGNAAWEILLFAPRTALVVSGPLEASRAEYYEALLVSPAGLRFTLSVNSSGILFIDEGLEAIDHANAWPVVLQSRNNILYVVDNRFKAPVPGGTGRGYGRRRS